MSDAETTPTVRRSARAKKQAVPIPIANSASKRRKRADGDHTDGEADDDARPDVEEDAPREDNDDQDDDMDDHSDSPRSKPKRKRATTKASPAKKDRVAAPKGKPRAPARKSKKGEAMPVQAMDFAKIAKETRISDDNALFNTIINPAAALQSTVEDLLDSFGQTPGLALADLINCILRACGCNAAVNEDEVLDADGIVETLDAFSEVLMKETAPPYPLISKLAVFKKFRKSMAEFVHRLIASAAELGVIYTTDLIPTLQQWTIAMSSAQLRSFRHTATMVALEVQNAMCEVAAAVEKEAEVVLRQRDGERKKKGKPSGREKELEGKANELHSRKTQLAEYLKEFVDGVFVHRYRDHYAEIRAECVQALGTWLKVHPQYFLEGQFLRYVGWVLSDVSPHVRLEAVRSLQALYSKPEYIASLRIFTERSKSRLVEMATSDTELSVRVATIQVLCIIDTHSLLEEEQRELLCLLVYDRDVKVRKAISAFVKGVWQEDLDSRLSGRKAAKDMQRAGIKSLAALLVTWAKTLEKNDAEPLTAEAFASSKEVAMLVSAQQKGRTALAVEALWDEVDAVSDWEALLDHLLLDHSAQGDGSQMTPVASRRKKAAKAKVLDDAVDPAWRLEDVEEGVILEVLVASVRKNEVDKSTAKKGESDSTVQADIARALISALPRLFAKYQTDEKRIADVLIIPQLMDLDMFLEMRVMNSYDALWDLVSKQFMSHSSPTVLNHAVDTIRHLMNAASLANTNNNKILELEDELASSLRDAVAGRDELEVATFTDDEVHALLAVALRISILSGYRDMTLWMEEDEGGKQSSAYDIVNALAERGGLGYKEEEQLVDQCLQLLTLHILWKARRLTAAGGQPAEDDPVRESLQNQRNSLLEKLTELTVGTRSKPCEVVARSAFQNMISIYVLFCAGQTTAVDGSPLPTAALRLEMDEQVQYRCAGFVQAEIEKYAEEIRDERSDQARDDKSDAASGTDDEGAEPKARLASKPKANGHRENSAHPSNISQSRLEREYTVNAVITAFLRALRAGVIDIRHAPVLLANYNHLETSFNSCGRHIVEMLREEGMYSGRGEAVASVVTQALKDAFTLYLEDVVHTEAHAVALAKTLASAFVVRGAQLAVLRRLDREHLVAVHTASLTWIIKQIQGHEANKHAKMKKKALTFFKVLSPLLASADSRDALKLKAHLDQALAVAKLEVGASSEWDPVRAYEKRLASKDKSIVPVKAKRGAKGKKSEYASSDDEHADGADGPGGQHEIDAQQPRPARAPRQPRLRAKAAAPDVTDEADYHGPRPSDAAPRTLVKRRSMRKANGLAARQDSESEATDGTAGDAISATSPSDDAMDDVMADAVVNGSHQAAQNSPTKKRARVQADDEHAGPASPARSHISVSEFKSRRKRVRTDL